MRKPLTKSQKLEFCATLQKYNTVNIEKFWALSKYQVWNFENAKTILFLSLNDFEAFVIKVCSFYFEKH